MLIYGRFDVHAQRVWGESIARDPAPYLLTLVIGTEDVSYCRPDVAAYPQTRAVMDDFGSLVIVRGWA